MSTPDEMKSCLQTLCREAQEKPPSQQAKGRGRGKAKGPQKKYTEVLVYALSVLDTVQNLKKTELENRVKAYRSTQAERYCTCYWSSSVQVVCESCRTPPRRKKFAQPHTVKVNKNEKGQLGLRFTGEWSLMLAEIKHGYPAGEVHALERFLEHRLSHINGTPIAGKEELKKAIAASKNEVNVTFYPRYMDVELSRQQYLHQLEAGRPLPIPMEPSEDEIAACRMSKRRQPTPPPSQAAARPVAPLVALPLGSVHRAHPIVESSASRVPGETPLDCMRRRWQGGRNDKLNLENLCKTRPNAWPALFRFVTESAQSKAIAEQARADASERDAGGIPQPGAFATSDVGEFYPPLFTEASRFPPKKSLQRALSLISKLRDDQRLDVFSVVVDEAAHGAPKYYEVIQRPVDLATMATRLQNHMYTSLEQVKEEVDLIWVNCRQYNPEPHWLHAHADMLAKEVGEKWKKMAAKCARDGDDSDDEWEQPSLATSSRSTAGKLRAKLAELTPYSATYMKLAEKIPAELYRIVAHPISDRPGYVDVCIELKVEECPDSRLKELLQSLERGIDTEHRRIKLPRKDA